MTDIKTVDASDDSPKIRLKIVALENHMRTLQQVDIKPVHYFAKGLYAREIFIPKGTLLTGKIHKSEHLNVISRGDISVVTEFGTRRIVAPFTMISQPGTKRVGYAHEDTVWTTIHATEETDMERVEKDLIATDYEELSLPESGGNSPELKEA